MMMMMRAACCCAALLLVAVVATTSAAIPISPDMDGMVWHFPNFKHHYVSQANDDGNHHRGRHHESPVDAASLLETSSSEEVPSESPLPADHPDNFHDADSDDMMAAPLESNDAAAAAAAGDDADRVDDDTVGDNFAPDDDPTMADDDADSSGDPPEPPNMNEDEGVSASALSEPTHQHQHYYQHQRQHQQRPHYHHERLMRAAAAAAAPRFAETKSKDTEKTAVVFEATAAVAPPPPPTTTKAATSKPADAKEKAAADAAKQALAAVKDIKTTAKKEEAGSTATAAAATSPKPVTKYVAPEPHVPTNGAPQKPLEDARKFTTVNVVGPDGKKTQGMVTDQVAPVMTTNTFKATLLKKSKHPACGTPPCETPKGLQPVTIVTQLTHSTKMYQNPNSTPQSAEERELAEVNKKDPVVKQILEHIEAMDQKIVDDGKWVMKVQQIIKFYTKKVFEVRGGIRREAQALVQLKKMLAARMKANAERILKGKLGQVNAKLSSVQQTEQKIRMESSKLQRSRATLSNTINQIASRMTAMQKRNMIEPTKLV